MNPWICMLIIFIAGGLGGFVNAFLGKDGIILPHWKAGIWCPGVLGNSFIGSIAALVSWGLYGSGNSVAIGAVNDTRTEVSLTIGACAGALLVGIGGSRWLSNEVDKQFLKEVATETAATTEISSEDRKRIHQAPPMQALEIAKSCKKKNSYATHGSQRDGQY